MLSNREKVELINKAIDGQRHPIRNEAGKDYWKLVRDEKSSPEFYYFIIRLLQKMTDAGCVNFRSGLKNSCFSPVSLLLAITMLLATAEPEKRDGFIRGELGVDLSWGEVYSGVGSLVIQIMSDTCSDVEIANILLYTCNATMSAQGEEYARKLSDDLLADTMAIDFGDSQAMQVVSDRISGMSHGLINPSMSSSADTLMELVNVLYFKSSWADEFDIRDTEPGIFNGANGEITVPFMKMSSRLCVYIGEGWTALTLPFKGFGWMRLILTREELGADELARQAPVLIEEAMSEHGHYNPLVHLRLPRFEARCDGDITSLVTDIGLGFLLDESANGLDKVFSMPMVLESAHQEAVVKVDEVGMEGAAFTSLFACGGMPAKNPDEISLNFDQPFIYMVESFGVPLFMGIVAEPEVWNDESRMS